MYLLLDVYMVLMFLGIIIVSVVLIRSFVLKIVIDFNFFWNGK